MKNISQSFKTFLADEEGATAIEYGLLAGLIAGVIITVVGTIGTDVLGIFNRLAAALPTV
jgi:pilus assembly protein Flp/PilA